jgi:RHS repeat-associated protein
LVASCNYTFLTRKERDNETGLDYFLARYYSSTQGRFTSPDEFTGGPDELYDFADDASDNPTFYADLSNPQSLNKYQYTYNDPLNLTDDDGHCPICVVVVVVTIEILLAPDTVNAPGPNDRTYPSGDGVKTLMTNATFGAIGGPLLSKGTRSLLNFAAGREATEVVGEAAARGARNPKVARSLAEGRAKHAEFAEKVKAKPGYKSEPSLKDPLTGKTVKPDAVTRGGRPVELKPKTPSGKAQGRRQLPAQERATGKKGRVVYYEPKQNQ